MAQTKPVGFKPGIALSDTLNEEQVIDLFSYIMEQDGSNLKKPHVRQKIFISNFNLIISVIKVQGFPIIKTEKNKKKGFIVFKATTTTFGHMLQAEPDGILNAEIIAILKLELENKRLPQMIMDIAVEHVTGPGRIMDDYTPETKAMLDFAIKEWNISAIAPYKERKKTEKQQRKGSRK